MFNTLRPRQHGRHFPDDIFKWIFFYENVTISINTSLKLVPNDPINNIPAFLVQTMACRLSGAKPLSEPKMLSSLTHICVTWAQWVKSLSATIFIVVWLLRASPLYIWFNPKLPLITLMAIPRRSGMVRGFEIVRLIFFCTRPIFDNELSTYIIPPPPPPPHTHTHTHTRKKRKSGEFYEKSIVWK